MAFAALISDGFMMDEFPHAPPHAPSRTMPSVGIVGAGMAGLSCAEFLVRSGIGCVVFDKSRGIGGRMSTRRVGDEFAFDHGAQFVRPKGPAFAQCLNSLREAGTVVVWDAVANEQSEEISAPFQVGSPAMNRMLLPLTDGVDMRLGDAVTHIERQASSWVVHTENGGRFNFDVLVSTIPVVQMRQLCANHRDLVDQVQAVEMDPCWAMMVGFAHKIEVPFDVWRHVSPAIGWMARNSSKPGRRHKNDCWVVHASPQWSRAHLEGDRDEISNMMLGEFAEALGKGLPRPAHLDVHRWRYAQTIVPLGKPFAMDVTGTLFAGGDWCLGARVEAAFDSGTAIANCILESVAK